MQTEQIRSESQPFIATSKTVQPTPKTSAAKPQYSGLTKDEVKEQSKQPCWKNLRLLIILLVIFLLAACLLAAIIIVIYHSRCAPRPNLSWWQKDTAYQIQLTNFKDSDGDGLGDLNGLKSKLDYLENLGVKTLSLSNVNSKNSPTKLDPIFGDNNSMKDLRKELDKRGMHLIMDLPSTYLEENDKATLEYWLTNLADGIKVTKPSYNPNLRKQRSFDNATIAKKFDNWKSIVSQISKDSLKEKFLSVYPQIDSLQTPAKVDQRFMKLSLDQVTDGSLFINMINNAYKNLETNDWPIFPLADFSSSRLSDLLEGSKLSPIVQSLIMLLKGTPVTMYGDEFGLSGENAYMLWDSSAGCGFTTEENLSEYLMKDNQCDNSAEKALGSVNSPALLFKNVVKLREEPSLLWGDVKTSSTNNENLISFVREAKGFDSFLVAANTGDNELSQDLQAKHGIPSTAKVVYFYSINENRRDALKKNDQIETNKVSLKKGDLLLASFKKD